MTVHVHMCPTCVLEESFAHVCHAQQATHAYALIHSKVHQKITQITCHVGGSIVGKLLTR